MTRQQLIAQILQKKSFLCVGLDTDLHKISTDLAKHEHAIFAFNKKIIDATAPYTMAYKPNLAFYEAQGLKGWENLVMTVDYIRQHYPDIFLIADAKRGDIGNTSTMYARAFFEQMDFDAVTVAPYMGHDSVKPFLEFPNKWVIVLGLTSNEGASDFQYYQNADGQPLYREVIEKSAKWGHTGNMMFVVGATQATHLKVIREMIPDHFLLIPGIGAQGGSLQDVAQYGMNDDVGLLVNASRSILYAGNDKDFAEKSAIEAKAIQSAMAAYFPG